MKTATPIPATLADLHNHPGFVPFGSTSDDWINDSDRMERCYEAAEHGEDGSFHAEVINDWHEFLERLDSDFSRSMEEEEYEQWEAVKESIEAEIDACEQWHEENGSLYKSA
jgi:hypothetical protein